MAEEWFYAKDGQQAAGPVSAVQLKQLAGQGQIGPNDLVWKQGMVQWAPASQIKGLLGSSPEQRATPAAPRPAEAATVAAALPPAPVAGAPPLAADNRGSGASAEPWFYGFLERFTRFGIVLGLVMVGLSGLWLLVSVASLFAHGAVLPGLFALLAGLVAIALLVLAVLFQAALVLLAVDAGRALRAIRKNTPDADETM